MNFDWEAHIKRVDNGFVVKYIGPPETEDQDNHVQEIVYKMREDVEDDPLPYQDIVYDLREHFGDFGGKYSKERLEVNIVHGDAYECKDKKCTICEEERDRIKWAQNV